MDRGSFTLDVDMQTSSRAEAPRPDDCDQAIATLVARVLAAKLPPGVSIHVVLEPSEDVVASTVMVYFQHCKILGRRVACQFSDFAAAMARAETGLF